MSTPQPAYVSDLAERAAEARALWRTLQVRCPASGHEHAVANVPCTPPSAVHPRGWVCVERHRREIDTRDERDRRRYREELVERELKRVERRAENASRERAHRLADVAAATIRAEVTR